MQKENRIKKRLNQCLYRISGAEELRTGTKTPWDHNICQGSGTYRCGVHMQRKETNEKIKSPKAEIKAI